MTATLSNPASPAAAGSVLLEPDERSNPARARWERPALSLILLATGVCYLWGLSASGWANSFYSAAVQAGSVSWKAFLFGSSDAANSITVDKPPASLWPMELSVRIFGLNSWAMLVPQALMGVATVGAVWYAVRRWFSAGAAVVASVVMAMTPVAVLMFRFNNPDALLTLVMVLAAITALRGIEDGRPRWAVATGVLMGIGFLTKQLQVMAVLPPFALAYFVAGKGRWTRRLRDLVIAGCAMFVAAGWWVALVELWPASSRPYIGGSQNNSFLELTLGYNGLGRITGNETGSVGGGGPGGPGGNGSQWGQTGITRMFDGAIGGQVAWLIPVALVAMLAGFWVTRRSPRTDLQRASLIVWGGWLVLTGLIFSFMSGIFHEYYTVALAPAIAVLVGVFVHLVWSRRGRITWRIGTAMSVAGTALWSVVLLRRATDWNTWLQWVVIGAACAAIITLAVGWSRQRWCGVAGAVAAVGVGLVGPIAWSVQTIATEAHGSIVTAGPAVAGARGPGGPGGPGAGGPGGQGGAPGAPGRANGGVPNQGLPSAPGVARSTQFPSGPPPGGGLGGPGPGGGGGMGGLLDAQTPSAEVIAALTERADEFTWVAATVGAQQAAGLQLATEQPVMPIGGFNGSDPSPTLDAFIELVAEGRVHYFVGGGGFGPSQGGANTSSAIANWVQQHYQSKTVGGVMMYDLTVEPT